MTKEIREGDTFRKTLSGWKPFRIDAPIVFVSVIVGSAGVVFLTCVGGGLDPASAKDTLIFGGLFAASALVFALNAFIACHISEKGLSVVAQKEWEGLPRSIVESLAPLEVERIRLEHLIQESLSILNDLSEESLRRPAVQARADELADEMSMVELQIESTIDDFRQEAEVDQKMREIDKRTRRELDAESRADTWLG